MKKTETLSGGENYTAVDIGAMDELSDFSFLHPVNGQEVKGKVFLKELTGSTGTEISFQVIPPHTDLSYFHIHNRNEETYIFIKGSGDFQVDDDCFPVKEGSVVRVAPAGIRSMRNSGGEEMVCIIIQSGEGTLEQYSSADGVRVDHRRLWKEDNP